MDLWGDDHDGFSAEGMRAWSEAGFEPEQAHAWSPVAVLKHAVIWHGFGISPADATSVLDALLEEGMDPALGLLWAATRLPLDYLLGCVQAGLKPHEAGEAFSVPAETLQALAALRRAARLSTANATANARSYGNGWAQEPPF